MDYVDAAKALQEFGGTNLGLTISRLEQHLQGITAPEFAAKISEFKITTKLLSAAGLTKQIAGQINVVIHALGITFCLPHLLEEGEVTEYLSLGAGNTGRKFDLETNRRIAEFKFINWRGGPESIRQNGLFKDFFFLARYPTQKLKYLYVLGTELPLKFFNGGRRFKSVLSKDDRTARIFREDFGDRYERVREYYQDYKGEVIIEDVSKYLPDLFSINAES